MFGGRYTGCTEDTGVEMPDFAKIAAAFELPYIKINGHADLDEKLRQIYLTDGAVVVEWPQDPAQVIEPRVMNRKDENGNIVSSGIDDMAPFLDKAEYDRMQYSAFIKEQI